MWIDDQNQKNMPISKAIIKAKAIKLYKRFAESSGDNPNKFVANSGWFDKFRNRNCLQNIKLSGESASADHDAAAKYPEEFTLYPSTSRNSMISQSKKHKETLRKRSFHRRCVVRD